MFAVNVFLSFVFHGFSEATVICGLHGSDMRLEHTNEDSDVPTVTDIMVTKAGNGSDKALFSHRAVISYYSTISGTDVVF